ncbi:MAG: hypothetical protein VX324_02665 [Pseudomonadota bacterium]|uniref:hypothetical protein n=1 Tax=Marinobacter sp. TaxID=50741 RepID=UPI002E8A4C59|nr:hypothetical protein [Pseudomonadota bacterium]
MALAKLSDASGWAMSRWFRLAVALAILATLGWFLLGVLERETRNAEERAANMVLGQLRSALVIKGAEVMLGRDGNLAEHQGINPFELIEHQWSRYRGHCSAPIPDPGTWCFQTRQHNETDAQVDGWLIYNPRQPITIDRRNARSQQPMAWQVTTEFSDRNGNGVREQEERLTGLKLAPVSLAGAPVTAQDARN